MRVDDDCHGVFRWRNCWPMGSHKDRHEVLGGGFIGLDALVRVVKHPSLKDLPFYLETPNELPGYASEIALMRKLAI